MRHFNTIQHSLPREINFYKVPKSFVSIYHIIIKIFCALLLFWNRSLRKQIRKYLYSLMKYSSVTDDLIIIYSKYLNYLNHKSSISTLILGSSHGLYGYRPCTTNELNLSFSSQDLYYAYNLFKITKSDFSNLKTIILFFSPFSSGFYIQKSSLAVRDLTASMNLIWKIPRYTGGKVTKEELDIEIDVESFLKRRSSQITELYEPYVIDLQHKTSIANEKLKKSQEKLFIENELKRTNKHFIYATQDGAMQYLSLLLEEAMKSNLFVYIVLPPFMQEYVNALDTKQSICFNLDKYLKGFSNVQILNFMHDFSFTKDDFMDIDHLNENGALKLSSKIRAYIYIAIMMIIMTAYIVETKNHKLSR